MPRDYQFTPRHVDFILSNAGALCSAAALLGGDTAEERVKRLADDMCIASPVTRSMNRQLDILEDLLALTHVDDPERLEAERFAMIDPKSPVVEEICLLLDGLREARSVIDHFSA
jgi:hypothetical protein